jgi:hypothetical protein
MSNKTDRLNRDVFRGDVFVLIEERDWVDETAIRYVMNFIKETQQEGALLAYMQQIAIADDDAAEEEATHFEWMSRSSTIEGTKEEA